MFILYSVLVLFVMSLVLGVIIAVFAKVFEVRADPRVALINDVLPEFNCGNCGYPGCIHYAEAIIEQGAAVTLCAPGGHEVVEKIRKIMAETAKGQTA